MTEDDVKNEVSNDNAHEEATEPPPDTKIETVEEPTPKEEARIETNEVKEEEAQFKNKTDRLRNKKVNCKDCGANVTLKTLRCTHKCSKTEDKQVKPKPRAKPKIVAIQPTMKNEVITNAEPAYIQQVQQQFREPEPPPPIAKTPQEIINDNFMLVQQQYINQRREKANTLVQSMFSGGLRNKRR